MKFSCYKEDLVDALKAVMPAVAVKPQTPILSGVCLKAEGNTLEIQGNNYTNGVIAKIPVNNEDAGEVVVVGKKFLEFVARMPDRTLTCAVENNSLRIESGGATVSLLTMPVADFPKVKTLDAADTFTIKAGDLHDLIRKTVFATDTSKGARPIFTGVNFDFHDNCLTLAATNTHRIAVAKSTLELNRDSFAFVVPNTALYTVLARFNPKDAAETVAVKFTYRYVAFTFGNIFMTARRLEGQFPPFDRVIPTDNTTNVTVNVAEFKEAIDIVALMAKETEYNTVKLYITTDSITLSADSREIGGAVKAVEALVEGDELNIAFSAFYLSDVLRVVDATAINIAFNDKFSPAAVTVPGDDDYVYVVTPVRT